MSELIQSLLNFLVGTGIWKVMFTETGMGHGLFDLADAGWAFNPTAWQLLVMYVIVGFLVYLAIVKKFEPLLLLPIAIGMMLTNLPGANLFHLDYFIADNIDFNLRDIVLWSLSYTAIGSSLIAPLWNMMAKNSSIVNGSMSVTDR